MKIAGVLICIVATASLAPAQGLKFEVASLKEGSGSGVLGGCRGIGTKYVPFRMGDNSDETQTLPLGRCVITDGRLSHLIAIAWDLKSRPLTKGGLDWILNGNDRYTIQARAEYPGKTTEAQLREMLQALLVDRFRLKFHREEVIEPGFALAIGKNGPKMQLSTSRMASTQVNWLRGQRTRAAVAKFPIASLPGLLSGLAGMPVVDRTGLRGEYDVALSFDETKEPALTTAVQEQLGLKLESEKVPVSMFVIDSAEKPSPD